MKIWKFGILMMVVASLALVTSCGDDDEEEVSPYVGNYVISKSTLAESFSIPIVGLPAPLPLPVGTDLTAAIQASMLGTAGCTSADKTWIELRKDMSMYMSCEGTNAKNTGTWQEVSPTELKLNMNATAIPSSPAGVTLSITNVVKTATSISGKTTIPFPKETVAAMVAAQGGTLAPTAPPVFTVTLTIEFTKK